MNETLDYYQQNAAELAGRYNSAVGGISEFFAVAFLAGSKILDVGCGSGRDLNRLVEDEYDAYGVDCCEELLDQAHKTFPNLSDRLSVDSLPDLTSIDDHKFDGVLCSAVLMHLPKEELFNTAYSLRRVLREGGRLLISIPRKDTTIDPITNLDNHGRYFSGVTAEELQLLFERLGFKLQGQHENEDSLKRSHRQWVTMWFSLEASDGSRSLDKIESVLNKDKKVATYKPALFRALSDIAQTNYNLATWHHNKTISLPIREISLKWIVYYWPIVESGQFIPQIQAEHTTGKQLAFRPLLNELVKAYQAAGGLSGFLGDMRSGRLSKENQKIHRQLISKLNGTIKDGPVRYSGGFGSCNKIFTYNKDDKEIVMPADLWRELSIMGKWIADSTVLRWAELTHKLSQNSIPKSLIIEALLKDVEPGRDVNEARKFYGSLVGKQCVWSGKSIDKEFVVDHAIPYAHWKNNDLWNLLPTDGKINGKKSDKLPTQELLHKRKDCVINYWQSMSTNNRARFEYEAERFAGKSVFKNNNWENCLFSSFQEAVEITARQRGLERWQTEIKQSTGIASIMNESTVVELFEDVDRVLTLSLQEVHKYIYKRFLPIVGDFAAGSPFQGFEVESLHEQLEELQWVEVPENYCNKKSFVIRVAGDSMEPTIMMGDYLVCEYHRHRQPDHDIVIMSDFSYFDSGEEAIKRISESQDYWIFQSDNSKYDDIKIQKEGDEQYPILGVVVYNLSQQKRCR